MGRKFQFWQLYSYSLRVVTYFCPSQVTVAYQRIMLELQIHTLSNDINLDSLGCNESRERRRCNGTIGQEFRNSSDHDLGCIIFMLYVLSEI